MLSGVALGCRRCQNVKLLQAAERGDVSNSPRTRAHMHACTHGETVVRFRKYFSTTVVIPRNAHGVLRLGIDRPCLSCRNPIVCIRELASIIPRDCSYVSSPRNGECLRSIVREVLPKSDNTALLRSCVVLERSYDYTNEHFALARTLIHVNRILFLYLRYNWDRSNAKESDEPR